MDIRTADMMTDTMMSNAMEGMMGNTPMDTLNTLGFSHVGDWRLEGNYLTYDLDPTYRDERGIYVFVINDTPVYLGACRSPRMTLGTRMDHYAKASRKFDTTESFINSKLRTELSNGNRVNIFFMSPTEEITYRGIKVDLIMGLERPIRDTITPDWNEELLDRRRAKRNSM